MRRNQEEVKPKKAPMIFFVLALLFLTCVIAFSIRIQYRRSIREYKRLAESLCDPGSWSITFLIRMVVLKGKVDGLPIRYSVLGSPQGEPYTTSYLLLLCPVMRNFRMYAGSDLSEVDDTIKAELEMLQQIEGFRGVVLSPAASPFLGKLLSRPLGFSYEPGILLWKLGGGAFKAESIRADLAHLTALRGRTV